MAVAAVNCKIGFCFVHGFNVHKHLATQASEWLQSADDHSLAPSTALGKAMGVASRFGPMDAAYEQML